MKPVDGAAPSFAQRLATPPVAAGVDVVAVLLFVAIGRRSHDEDGSVLSGVFTTAAPLLIALAIGWLIARAWTQPVSLRTGTIVWVATVALGMVLRKLVFDRGTATAFVIVTTIMLCLFLQGWRLGARHLPQRRTA
ncbi:MAG TPA: DUF3054 domain-containing protein [Ilumatobacteraceae bacterium]|nr:DUF3054 domain-containing protein [Ilumatobacteraceae bacterium]